MRGIGNIPTLVDKYLDMDKVTLLLYYNIIILVLSQN